MLWNKIPCKRKQDLTQILGTRGLGFLSNSVSRDFFYQETISLDLNFFIRKIMSSMLRWSLTPPCRQMTSLCTFSVSCSCQASPSDHGRTLMEPRIPDSLAVQHSRQPVPTTELCLMGNFLCYSCSRKWIPIITMYRDLRIISQLLLIVVLISSVN